MTLGEQFREVVKARNWHTPTVVGYYSIKYGIAELSKGEMTTGMKYGVTVVKHGRQDTDLNDLFNSEAAALSYIKDLQQ